MNVNTAGLTHLCVRIVATGLPPPARWSSIAEYTLERGHMLAIFALWSFLLQVYIWIHTSNNNIMRSSMAPRSVRFAVRSRKLSNFWSIKGWVTKNLLSRAQCFGRPVKPVPATFAVGSTHHPHWARVVGYGPFSGQSIRKACAPAVGTLIGWWWWWWMSHRPLGTYE
jgi:hypothetical protein